MNKNLRQRKIGMKVFARVLICSLFLFPLFSLSLLSGNRNVVAAQSTPVTVEVKIDNFSFGPQALTIAPGTKVTWTNRDDIPHTVVSTEGVFKSRVLDTDEKFSFTFDKPGNYPYFCSVHPKMTGTVIVK
jgi:plastocyanin